MSYLAGGKGGGPRPTNGVDNSDPISSAIVKYNYQVQEYLLSTIYIYLLSTHPPPQAQQLDELSLVKGSRVMILEKSGDGWWRGQYGNKVH